MLPNYFHFTPNHLLDYRIMQMLIWVAARG